MPHASAATAAGDLAFHIYGLSASATQFPDPIYFVLEQAKSPLQDDYSKKYLNGLRE
jgi:hypothetical protein